MQDKISIPTDNIYKFYALFSLLLVVFSLSAVIYVNKFTNDIILKNVVEIETLKQETPPTRPQLVRQVALERQVEIATANKRFYVYALGVLLGLSSLGMYYGFSKWHKEVQPLNDEMARIQLEIAKLQLAKLKAEEKRDRLGEHRVHARADRGEARLSDTV